MKKSTKKPGSKKFKKGVILEAKRPRDKSPNISRLFTDKNERGSLASLSGRSGPKGATREIHDKRNFLALFLNKYFIISFLTTFLGVALTLQGITVQKSLNDLQNLEGKREKLEKEVLYWEGIATSHKSYRDAYFKLALLQYQLGNKEKARLYIEKTLEIDPNFTPALDFGQVVGFPYSL